VVNGGSKHKPRLVSAIEDSVTHNRIPAKVSAPDDLKFNPEHVAVVKKALLGVTQEGTSARAFAGAQYLSGGKTGTAQAVTIGQKEKYNASKLEEHKRDHALYMAYAPADNPTIALAIVVENSGFGAEHAAPITRRVFDYWVAGIYPSEEDIAAVQKAQAAAPIGKPRKVSEMPWPPKGQDAVPEPVRPASATASNATPAASAAAPSASAAKPIVTTAAQPAASAARR
jgi:penicillin-binding protein 2